MQGIQIKIADEWVMLPEDFSISLEQTSPIFNNQGVFSFPFEISLEANRHVFKNIADPFGRINLKDIDHLPTEVWFNGIMLYKGIIETDEEVELEDSISVTFLSGNSDFMNKLEEINAREVPLDRELYLGYVVNKGSFTYKPEDGIYYNFSFFLPEHVTMEYINYNVKDPYPIKPYCNVRVCTQSDAGGYCKLEAKRPFSGVCFYVRYFLDCLWKHLSLSVAEDQMEEIEDMNRLAFFTTQCHVTYGDERELTRVELNDFLHSDGGNHIFELNAEIYVQVNVSGSPWHESYSPEKLVTTIKKRNIAYKCQDVYATNENFPDITAKELVEDLQNAFGVRFLFDEKDRRLHILMLKNIFTDSEIHTIHADIMEVSLERDKHSDIKITYGETDDTAFNYTDYSNVKECKDYKEILEQGVSAYDKRCFVDKTTGNAYRNKVNKDTGGDPSLFEVGGFRDYLTNPDEKEDEVNETSLSFKPVIVNDISKHFETSGENQQLLAVFVDTELKSTNVFSSTIFNGYTAHNGGDFGKYIVRAEVKMKHDGCQENFDTESGNEAPLRSYDAGFTLGIMRGPGNDSGIEYSENYDGEGNDSWVQTVGSYAFTADSCDNYGRFFDYNGTEGGGANQDGRFSLKLVAEKDGYPIGKEYANRGMVSKFQTEYLYFMANHKTVVLTVKMSISQILTLNLLKRQSIGHYLGFINRISYTLRMDGVSDVKIELYAL